MTFSVRLDADAISVGCHACNDEHLLTGPGCLTNAGYWAGQHLAPHVRWARIVTADGSPVGVWTPGAPE